MNNYNYKKFAHIFECIELIFNWHQFAAKKMLKTCLTKVVHLLNRYVEKWFYCINMQNSIQAVFLCLLLFEKKFE